ncbi:hypothetical protein Vafri_3390 [Volvox africanus]|uniref:Uncharacterized protein n=1 Tax=Volvox africanus TaxID=51714 RepID=A0A8J4AT02_9CHLO|nr:hypothetical protein Vafri_3390 [Volvox africanus]
MERVQTNPKAKVDGGFHDKSLTVAVTCHLPRLILQFFLFTGKPLFGTLISLVYEGSPVLGIIDQPITKERWVGVVGQPTTLNGQTLRTRPCTEVKLAYLYATTPHMFSGDNEVAFNRLRDQVRIPMYGCDCYAYGLLAAGHCDLVVEADLKPYDYMALVPVVQVLTVCGCAPLLQHQSGD